MLGGRRIELWTCYTNSQGWADASSRLDTRPANDPLPSPPSPCLPFTDPTKSASDTTTPHRTPVQREAARLVTQQAAVVAAVRCELAEKLMKAEALQGQDESHWEVSLQDSTHR